MKRKQLLVFSNFTVLLGATAAVFLEMHSIRFDQVNRNHHLTPLQPMLLVL